MIYGKPIKERDPDFVTLQFVLTLVQNGFTSPDNRWTIGNQIIFNFRNKLFALHLRWYHGVWRVSQIKFKQLIEDKTIEDYGYGEPSDEDLPFDEISFDPSEAKTIASLVVKSLLKNDFSLLEFLRKSKYRFSSSTMVI